MFGYIPGPQRVVWFQTHNILLPKRRLIYFRVKLSNVYLKQTFSDQKTFYALLKRIDSYRTTDAHARTLGSKHEKCLRWVRSRRLTSVSVVVDGGGWWIVEQGSQSFVYHIPTQVRQPPRRARYATSPATPPPTLNKTSPHCQGHRSHKIACSFRLVHTQVSP